MDKNNNTYLICVKDLRLQDAAVNLCCRGLLCAGLNALLLLVLLDCLLPVRSDNCSVFPLSCFSFKTIQFYFVFVIIAPETKTPVKENGRISVPLQVWKSSELVHFPPQRKLQLLKPIFIL